MSKTTSLSVIVVGGGVGGLTASIALRRAGHSVTVFEKTSFANEIGAAVTLASNAGYVLNSLGLDPERARLSLYSGTDVVKGDNFELMRGEEYNFAEKYKFPFMTAYRPDLQKTLFELATDPDGPGQPCTLHEKCGVEDFDSETGSITLADGCRRTADLVVAADGVHSRALDLIHGRECHAIPTNMTVIRFMLPTSAVLSDPETAPLLSEGRGHGTIYVGPAVGKRRFLVRYWCDAYERQNFGMYTVQGSAEADAQELRFKTDRDSLKRELDGFHPALLRVAEKAAELLPLWRCARREPVSAYSKGRMVVIGDAAHAMLPNIGQGANTAILDAGALGVLFEGLPDSSPSTIRKRLSLFDSMRPKMVAVTQLISDLPYWEDAVSIQKEKCLEFMQEEDLPKAKNEVRHWHFKYDVFDEARDLVQQLLSVS